MYTAGSQNARRVKCASSAPDGAGTVQRTAVGSAGEGPPHLCGNTSHFPRAVSVSFPYIVSFSQGLWSQSILGRADGHAVSWHLG